MSTFSTTPTGTYSQYEYTTASNGSTHGQHPGIDALLSGYQWTSRNEAGATVITYSFVNANSVFANNYSSYNEPSKKSYFSSNDQAAVRALLETIESVCNVDFVEVDDNASTCGVIRYAYSGVIDDYNNAAWAWFPHSQPRNGDIWVSPSYSATNSNTEFFFNHIVLHETLHALGLKHPFETLGTYTQTLGYLEDTVQYTVMSYSVASNTDVRRMDHWPDAPMLYDIATLQYLYGPSSYRPGDTSYDLSALPFAHQLVTLWDSAGNDTLDASNINQAVTIDLSSGHLSDIGQTVPTAGLTYTRTLAIANDCIIENLVGSAYDDVLTGNTANNSISGGSGNDTIFASAGEDTLIGGEGEDHLYYANNLNDFHFQRDGAYLLILNAAEEGDHVMDIESFDFAGSTYSYNQLASLIQGSWIWDSNLAFDNQNKATCRLSSETTHSITLSYTIKKQTFTAELLGTFDTIHHTGSINQINWIDSSNQTIAEFKPGNSSNEWGNVYTALIEKQSAQIWSHLFSDDNHIELSNANDNVKSYAGDDLLKGGDGNDTLDGGDGNDILDGGLGNDKLLGGSGNDTYVIDSLNDTLKDTSGTDLIETNINTFSLVKFSTIENLCFTGNSHCQLTGNKLANQINGYSGDDRIDGGLGNDTLTGGAGIDHFIFSTALKNNVDTITDFTTGTDRLGLSLKIFTKLKNDTDLLDNFCVNAAQDANDYLIYDTSQQILYYDADGANLVNSPIAVAIIGNIQYQDIFLI